MKYETMEAWLEAMQTANLVHWAMPIDSPIVTYRGKLGRWNRWGQFVVQTWN